MSAVLTKTLNFMTNDLGIDAILLLTFNKFSDGDKFPLCWKVITFPSRGPFRTTATYQNQLAFFKQIQDHALDTDVPVMTSTYQLIDVGQKTTLIQDNGIYRFTAPEACSGKNIKALNGTTQEETIGVGLITKDDFVPTPVFVFDGVPAGTTVEVQFTPILRAYITSNFQETQIIRGEIAPTLIWEQDLAALSDDTAWELNYDSTSGAFNIQSV